MVNVAAKEEKANKAFNTDELIDRNKKMPLSRKIWFDVTRLIDPALQYVILGYGRLL